LPTADDGLAVVINFTTGKVNVDFTAGVAENRHGDKVIGGWSAVSFMRFLEWLAKEQF
jgi:hypothetical protein